MNIKILNLSTGISILGYIKSEDSDFYLVSNPYIITGMAAGDETFTPYSTFSNESVKVFKVAVVAEFEPMERLKISYAEKFEIPV